GCSIPATRSKKVRRVMHYMDEFELWRRVEFIRAVEEGRLARRAKEDPARFGALIPRWRNFAPRGAFTGTK
ncbi:MAG: hypothetical protein ACRDSJ_24250, partial [Rubrobacteraceae bacterium]